MTDVENTSERDPLHHLVGMGLGSGWDTSSDYITGMEAAGQKQLVASTKMPTEAPWDKLTELGFVKGEAVPGDDIFCEATLPEGWERKASDHSMWSYIVDDRGIERVAIFYKAAFYDRSAHASLSRPGYSAASSVIYGDDVPALPEKWNVFTDEEKADFWSELERYAKDAEEHPEYTHRQKELPRVKAVLALREQS